MAEWRPIPGFETYEASDEGVIRPRAPRYKNGRGANGLRPWIVERHGRKAAYVSLHVDGVRTKHLVHVLVCMAFHGARPEGSIDCCHRDHDSLNNRASNLKWDTHSKNIEEQWEQRRDMETRLADALGDLPCYNGPDPRSDVPF